MRRGKKKKFRLFDWFIIVSLLVVVILVSVSPSSNSVRIGPKEQHKVEECFAQGKPAYFTNGEVVCM